MNYDKIIMLVFLAEKHPEEFEIFHALDVWHKSTKLSKKLAKVYNHIFGSYFVFRLPFHFNSSN